MWYICICIVGWSSQTDHFLRLNNCRAQKLGGLIKSTNCEKLICNLIKVVPELEFIYG